MSNQDFDTDETGPPVDFAARRAQVLVTTGADANPDEAARANELADATGMSPSAAYENRENLEPQVKARMAGDIVRNNNYLQDYVNSHPLAAKVSNDDYGQLDTVSQAVDKVGGEGILAETLKAFKENAGLEGLGEEHERLAAALASNPLFGNVFIRQATDAAITAPVLAMHLASGVIGAGAAAIGSAYKQMGADKAVPYLVGGLLGDREEAYSRMSPEALTRDLITYAQVGLSGQAGLHGPVAPEVTAAVAEAAKMAKVVGPYVEAGKEPPVGVHPVLDQMKADQATTDAANLKDALKESVASATRERSPDMFTKYVQGITDGNIGISADAVRALYGDKVPAAGDGLLGFVPDLADQLGRAEATGGDVQVPIADWLGKIEPDVAKALEDHIRARPEGMTVEEAKEAPEHIARYNPVPLEETHEARDVRLEQERDARRVSNPEEDSYSEEGNLLSSLKEATAYGTSEDGMTKAVRWAANNNRPDIVAHIMERAATKSSPDFVNQLQRIVDFNKPVENVLQAAEGPKILPEEQNEWIDAYHGTGGDDFSQFDTSKSVRQAYGVGIHVAEHPNLANVFASQFKEGGRVMPVQVRLGKSATGDIYKGFADENDFDMAKTTEAMKAHGYDSVTYDHGAYHNVVDGKLVQAAVGEDKAYAIFDPKNIRPKYAPVDTVRQAAGLQGIQERKLSLRPANSARQRQAGIHTFEMVDQNGGSLGHIDLAEENGGKRLFVDNIENPAGAQSVGSRAIRDVTEQLAEQFPNAETLEGMRVSGGREKANKENVKAGIDLNKVRERAAARKQAAASITDPAEAQAFEKAAAIGMTVKQHALYQKLIERRATEDAEAANARAMADQRRTQTAEWKANRAELRPQVKADIEARPEVELDEMLRAGKVKLNPEGLTDDQKALLPKSFVSADGIHPADLAGLFGDTQPAALVDRLVALARSREQAGMKPGAHLSRMVDIETDRQMEAKYGSLDRNVLEEAKDQVLSQTQEDLLHEETMARAAEAGLQYPITKDELRGALQEFFNKSLVRDVSSDKGLAEAGRAGRATEMALLKGDYAEAFRQKQRQYNAIVMANMAKKFEKAQAQFEKLAKRFSSREVAGVDQSYTNLIHDALGRVGEPVKRTVQDLQTELQKSPLGYKDMPTFVAAKTKDTFGMWESPIADFLLDPAWKKPLKDLTTEQFSDFKMSLDALNHLGRDEKKLEAQGEKADRTEVINKMKEQLATFPLKTYEATQTRIGKVLNLPKSFFAGSTSTETLLNRWDRNDPHGLFNRYLTYPLTEAANHAARLDREMAVPYRALGELKDPEKPINPPPFNDPYTKTKDNPEGKPFIGFTRRNGLAILQNYGNKENWRVMTKGYGVETPILKDWLFANFPDKADWDRAQAMGKTIFDPLFEQAQTVYRNINGVAPAKIPLEMIDTPFGKMDGWYHPLIKDPLREGTSKAQRGGGVYDNEDYGHASIANGYTKSRTGAAYPLSLDFDTIPVRMKQMIHDIAFRQAVMEAEKVFNDTGFRAEVAKHYGDTYRDGLMPYLRGIAGSRSINSRGMAEATRVSNYLRSNIIGSLIGFNPYTALKHGPTALYLSMKEVGPVNFWKAFAELNMKAQDMTEHNKDFVDQNSEEVQRRQRNWDETIGGTHKDIYGEGTTREKILHAGSWMVAQSDMISVRATWLAAYNKEMARAAEAGEDNHGLAVAIGNRAVRRAHGSTAITNLPSLVRGAGPLESWMTTLYGFFGTMMQRRIELAHQANDTYHLVKDGEIMKAAGNLPSFANNFFTYVVVPTAVEEWVTSLSTDDRRGWGHHILDAALGGAASSVLYVRDIVHGLITGQEPSVGLISTPLHDMKNLGVDFSKGKHMMSRGNAGKLIGDALTVFGEATGRVPKVIADAVKFGINTALGEEHPKGLNDLRLGLTRGTLKRPVIK